MACLEGLELLHRDDVEGTERTRDEAFR